MSSVGFVLTIATLLFSFLVGYYLNSRYNRYIVIRDSHILRHSKCFDLLECCKSFSENKPLLAEAHKKLNSMAIMDELTAWDEGYLEEPYFSNLYDLLDLMKIKTDKDKELFKISLSLINEINDLTKKLTSIGNDTLGYIHWILLDSLSFVIILLTLSIPLSSKLALTIVMLFPASILLVVYVIYGYQHMLFLRESTFMEINQRIFDEIGKKRFYKKSKLIYVRSQIKNNQNLYQTEDDLRGEEKDVYLDYLDKEFYVDRVSKKKVHY